MSLITPQPGIMDIALYQGGAAHVPGMSNVIKLSSNENPLGPSLKAIEAVQNSAAPPHSCFSLEKMRCIPRFKASLLL